LLKDLKKKKNLKIEFLFFVVVVFFDKRRKKELKIKKISIFGSGNN